MGWAGAVSYGGVDCIFGCDVAAMIEVFVPTETEKTMTAFRRNATNLAPTPPARSAKKTTSASKTLTTTAIHLAGSPNWLDRVAVINVTRAPATPGVIMDFELRNSFIDLLLKDKISETRDLQLSLNR